MRSLLAGISPDQVVESPFPHVVVENAMDAELCSRLIAEFPALELFTGGKSYPSNKKIYYTGARALKEGTLSKTWTDVVAAYIAPSHWNEIARIFQKQIDREYPDFRNKFGAPETLKVGVRDIDQFSEMDVLLDCKALIHTPVIGPASRERDPHLKNFRTMFVWYHYLRSDDDHSEGGDHAFYRLKSGTEFVLGRRQAIEPDLLDVAKTIPYRQNTLVLFMNTPRSFQTNTARTESPVPLRSLHVSVYMRERLFAAPLKPGVSLIDFVKEPLQKPQKTGWLRSLIRG